MLDTPPHVKVDVELITPETAAKMLEKNDRNRQLNPGTADAYARVMKSGQWKLNGETIKLDAEGHILDGQHRLEGVVKSGVPIQVVVVRGVEREAQATMDDPRKRSALDQQRLRNSETPASAVAAARWLLTLYFSTKGRAQRITNTEVLAMLDKHPLLAESALAVGKRDLTVLRTIAVTFHYIASELLGKRDEIETALQVLESGVPSYEGDAMHAFREKLLKAKRHGGMGLSSRDQFDGMAHAFNEFIAKRSIKKFQIPEDVTIDGLKISML